MMVVYMALIVITLVRVPCKEEVKHCVKKGEDKTNYECLEESPGAPVLSPILQLLPQSPNVYSITVIAGLK